jgi:hypothetical protein
LLSPLVRALELPGGRGARPGSLDNATVERVVRVFTEEVALLAV